MLIQYSNCRFKNLIRASHYLTRAANNTFGFRINDLFGLFPLDISGFVVNKKNEAHRVVVHVLGLSFPSNPHVIVLQLFCCIECTAEISHSFEKKLSGEHLTNCKAQIIPCVIRHYYLPSSLWNIFWQMFWTLHCAGWEISAEGTRLPSTDNRFLRYRAIWPVKPNRHRSDLRLFSVSASLQFCHLGRTCSWRGAPPLYQK